MHVDPYYTKQNYTSKVELFLQQGIGVKVGKAFLLLYGGHFSRSFKPPPPIFGTLLQCSDPDPD
jgi:hypothetical protein